MNTDDQADSATHEGLPERRSAHLRILHAVPAVHLVTPAGLLLGRHVDGGGVTILDEKMSRRHVRVALLGEGWHLVDVGSRNGGFVDGRAFSPNDRVPLDDGAAVRLGDTLLVFRVADPPDVPDDDLADAYPGVSPVAAAVRARLQRLAGGVGHVLIVGETGTGKERAARSIARGTQDRPFVPQNCAELSQTMVRSELFGHVKGAFTGAVSPRTGLVEEASGGVLFLDEIGELSLEIQAELLRFLEDGSYRMLGSPALRQSTARIVAATNVDLDDAVRRGRFRRDLLARLRATNPPLELPPLRLRRDDILDWAARFLGEVASGWEGAPWTAGAAECLVLYPWPENLRELRGVMRALGEHRRRWPITPAELPPRIRDHRAAGRGVAVERTPPPPEAPPPPSPPLTRAVIVAALRATGGRMRTAALKLGIDRRKLYRLCQSEGIEVDRYRRPGDEPSR